MGFKDIKRAYIIEKAKELLLSTSIQEVTIKDVAQASAVGEATIYRYFQTKEKLVTEVAIALQKEIVASNIKEEGTATGYQCIEGFYNLFLNVYIIHPDYYRFISPPSLVANIRTPSISSRITSLSLIRLASKTAA